jgi:hypothetical protein
MIDWPPSLLNDIARRRVVLTIGSGVSRHASSGTGARPPTWKQFLEKAADDCPDHDIEHIRVAIINGDYLHACEWLKKRYDEQWTHYLRQVFQEPGFSPGELHQHLILLDNRIVFSLNFDDIYERAAQSVKAGSHVLKNYFDGDFHEFLRGNSRYIVKVHGNLNTPESLIFTQKEYARARVKHSPFYQAFDACLMTHSFLFVGAGITDPDVNLVLENQNFNFPASMPHYFLTAMEVSRDLEESLRQNRNLKIIRYDPLDDNHSGLAAEIKNLQAIIEEMRIDMGATQSW